MNQISMAGDVRGATALSHLVDPRRAVTEERDHFNIAASAMKAADAVTAAVLRASLEEFLVGGGKGLEYLPPSDGAVDQTLANLLGAMPAQCTISRTSKNAPARDRFAVAPASVIRSIDEIEPMVLGMKAIGPHVGLDIRETEMAAAAALAFAVNGLEHAPNSPCGVVLCAGVDPDNLTLTVAAVDLGGGPPNEENGESELRSAIERSRKILGGFAQMPQFAARKGLAIGMHLATGTGEAYWSGRWRYGVRQNVPGWISTLKVTGRKDS
jgi:hypothetical protein